MNGPATRRIIGGLGVVGFAQLLVRGRGVLLIPILARGLGAYEYGIWILVVSIVSLTSIVTMLGLPQALERFLAGTSKPDNQREDFLSSLALVSLTTGIVSLAVVASAGVWAVAGLSQPGLTPLFRLGAWILLATALNQVALMFFQSQREMRMVSGFSVVTGLGELLLSALAVQAGYGLYGALLALFVARGATTAVALGLIISRVGVATPRLVHMRAYLAFGIPTIAMELMYLIVETSDRYFVGFYGSPTQVGIYSAAYALASVLVFLRRPFMAVLPPFVYQFWDREDYPTVARYLDASLRSYLILAVPMAVGISMLARPALSILANPEFAVKGSPVVPIVVAAMFCYGLSGITGLVFWLEKKSRELSVVWAVAAACNTLLNVLLIPRWGIVGAAVATLVSYAISTGPCVIVYLRLMKRAPDVWLIAATVMGSFLMAALVRLLNPSDIGGLAVTAVLAACAYFGSLVLMRGWRLVCLGDWAGAMRQLLAARSPVGE